MKLPKKYQRQLPVASPFRRKAMLRSLKNNGLPLTFAQVEILDFDDMVWSRNERFEIERAERRAAYQRLLAAYGHTDCCL